MLSNWKKARKKLLEEGKFTRYLTYASGEIVIIAVGILLALYLNNWNQGRTDKRKEVQYYRNIQDQLQEDLLTLTGEIDYNRLYKGQFAHAAGLIAANSRAETDTLAAIALNMLRYSDFRRKSSIYQTLVNSGEFNLLENSRVTSSLETLEEIYLYINRLEENHSTLIISVIIPDLKAALQFDPIRVLDPDALFSPAFKNDFDILIGLMEEKSDAYGQATEMILGILQLMAGEPGCSPSPEITGNPDLEYRSWAPDTAFRVISREQYYHKLQGFWLGTCLGNWTGLVTEMDKIGDLGGIRTGDFYTRHDWGGPDQPSIWGEGIPSGLSPTIDFVSADPDSVWGADDDTDIEYIYQELLLKHKTSILTGNQIREGWLRHIRHDEENYLWVSNQKAFDLMKAGLVPPATGDPANNPEYEMIDAQLTTEIFGLFAPARPDVALKMGHLPIQATARDDSQWIAEFYVAMFSLASAVDGGLPMKEQVLWMADHASRRLPASSYACKMYAFVRSKYDEGIPWEQARDSVYHRYQVHQSDGYDLTSRNLYCNACFAAGINFAASLISLFYGEGDLPETIRIGTLAGWDSDNPTATWGGLLGFMKGKEGIEQAFGRKFSDRFHIHRTRTGFGNEGMDTFGQMALKGIWIVDRVVQEEMGGGIDLENNLWYIPPPWGMVPTPEQGPNSP